MDDRQRAILDRAAAQGITLHAAWVREWHKQPGKRRGRYRRTLKYYWMELDLLHSGPFTSQEQAVTYLANLFTKDSDHDH